MAAQKCFIRHLCGLTCCQKVPTFSSSDIDGSSQPPDSHPDTKRLATLKGFKTLPIQSCDVVRKVLIWATIVCLILNIHLCSSVYVPDDSCMNINTEAGSVRALTDATRKLTGGISASATASEQAANVEEGLFYCHIQSDKVKNCTFSSFFLSREFIFARINHVNASKCPRGLPEAPGSNLKMQPHLSGLM